MISRADGESAADALGHRDRIGRDAGVLEAEPRPRAPGAGLDLVDDEQRAVSPREFASRLEEALGKVDDARLTLDRFHDQGRDGVVDRRLERFDRRGNVLDAARQRLERIAHVRLSGERERPHRAAVERIDEGEHAGSCAARVIEARELERRLVGLGAGVAEPDAPALARAGEPREPLGEFELRARW